MNTTVLKQQHLGDVLLENGYVTEEQLDRALTLQKTTHNKRLGAVLVENGFITEKILNEALSKYTKLRYVSIGDSPLNHDAVKKIPKAIALKHNLIAHSIQHSTLRILTNDPLDYYALEDVKLITGMQIEVQICDRAEILKAIDEAYSEIEAQKAAVNANESAGQNNAFTYVDISEGADDTPVVTLINSTLYKAHSAGASDIHIEPFDGKTAIRIRVDGQIIDYLSLSGSLHNSIVARIKILSGLDIAEKRIPQDGHFRAKLQDIEINVRVSTLPTIYGEKLVLRFMSQSGALDNVKTFGMEHDDYEKMMKILKAPHGIIYITGPTGSGKTTTLYMIMEYLAKRHVNISTIEDPVEKNLAKINQTQINPPAGLTFESGLRSILRQDPDIIMIGETRDAETANISVRAALTGHLVMSSLHTNDSVASIVRLIDMGVEDYLLANSLVGVVAQRLVKKICPFCYEEYTPEKKDLIVLGDTPVEKLARGKGCHNCNKTGYKGRVAVHEIFMIDNRVRNLISERAPTEEIYQHLRTGGKFKDLQTSLRRLVLDKKTTVEELLKLTYYVE